MNHLVNANQAGLLYRVPHISHRILFFPITHLLRDSVTVEQMCCYKSGSIYVSYSGKCKSKWLHGALKQNIPYSNQRKNNSIVSQESNFDLLPLTIILQLTQSLAAVIANK